MIFLLLGMMIIVGILRHCGLFEFLALWAARRSDGDPKTLLTLLILLHKGRGGGLSDMFGGGVTSSLGASGVAERNLNRITIILALVWITCIVVLGLITKFDAGI